MNGDTKDGRTEKFRIINFLLFNFINFPTAKQITDSPVADHKLNYSLFTANCSLLS